MPRMRTIKPGFFTNEGLCDLAPIARILFAGLWCWADRDGRLEDRPRRIKAEILPYDEADADALLDALAAGGFIVRYDAAGKRCIQIVNFAVHQNPHYKEAPSVVPPPSDVQLSVDGRAPEAVSSPAPAAISTESSANGRAIIDQSSPDDRLMNEEPSTGISRVGHESWAMGHESWAMGGEQAASGAIDTSPVASRPSPRARSPDPDFTAWWAVYPRHDRPAAALEAYRRRRAAGRTAEQLLAAAVVFAAYQDALGTPVDKIPHALRFLGEERDLEWERGPPDAGRVVAAASGGSRAPTSDRRGAVFRDGRSPAQKAAEGAPAWRDINPPGDGDFHPESPIPYAPRRQRAKIARDWTIADTTAGDLTLADVRAAQAAGE
jgi:hypothetical protein